MKTFGLVGYPLGHSFSKKYFTEKFEKDGLADHQYVNFEIESIAKFPGIFDLYDNIGGLNCTIPYKQQIMPFLNEIDDEAKSVGAVNTVKIINTPDGMRLKGFNTDVIGFEESLKPMLNNTHKKALILGTGGASKAVKFILSKLGIDYISASIEEELLENEVRYTDIDKNTIAERTVIINATPLGTHPNGDKCADIPYEAITDQHVLFDLVYNPDETLFMKKGRAQGAKAKNGLEMLHGQAEAAWKIWNALKSYKL
ncbi:MAG TPA: shikimate dehydrogenase [Prolixibacteraceae bacterium]|nr:shikimate dehydrogenase [Prolixibacteraceae bacterium]